MPILFHFMNMEETFFISQKLLTLHFSLRPVVGGFFFEIPFRS